LSTIAPFVFSINAPTGTIRWDGNDIGASEGDGRDNTTYYEASGSQVVFDWVIFSEASGVQPNATTTPAFAAVYAGLNGTRIDLNLNDLFNTPETAVETNGWLRKNVRKLEIVLRAARNVSGGRWEALDESGTTIFTEFNSGTDSVTTTRHDITTFAYTNWDTESTRDNRAIRIRTKADGANGPILYTGVLRFHMKR
jgi:hypothetical protein